MPTSTSNEETLSELISRVCQEKGIKLEFVVREFIDGVIHLKHDEDTDTHPAVDVAGGHVRPSMPPITVVDTAGNIRVFPYLAFFPKMQTVVTL
jgi:hypothetical protein